LLLSPILHPSICYNYTQHSHSMADLEHDPTGFEDEPLGETGESAAFSFEGVDEVAAKAERRRLRRIKRAERIGKISAAIFCIILIVVLILTFKVFKATEGYVHDAFVLETETPTIAPTHVPTRYSEPASSPVAKPTFSVRTPAPTEQKTDSPTSAPTQAPTITPFPTARLDPVYLTTPIEDTYFFVDGPNSAKGYGREDKLFVQHGTKLSTKPGQDPDIPTGNAILKFDLKKISDFPERRRWPEDMQVKLLLTHKLESGIVDDDRTPSKLEVYRMPNNYDLEVEAWTGTSFNSAPKFTREGILVGSASIPADDTDSMAIDITKALYLSDDKMATGYYKDDQILLMLAINDGTPRDGDEFGSRESDAPPVIQFVMQVEEEEDVAP
ncbi:MAG: hypothetical protein SGILL_002059, partial [Bacillariaceae sp.]